MKCSTNHISRSQLFYFFLSIILICGIQSCKSDKEKVEETPVEEPKDAAIVIVTEGMDFQMPDTISSGWNTFRYVNKSKETHFFILNKYPEGVTIKDGEKEVGPVFQKGMDLINENKLEEAFTEFGNLPEWYSNVVIHGGSGLVSPGYTSQTTLKLDPGYYVVECYVKMANGIFHTSMGMIKELIVKEENSNNSPPKPTVDVSISSVNGILHKEVLSIGKQIFSVNFTDQIVHENFVGHDVNLVKLDDNADLDALEKWMNWSDPIGLMTPAPDGVTFLGGVNDMPAGGIGYFSVSLDSGNYALISEVPNTRDKNLLKTFEVIDQ